MPALFRLACNESKLPGKLSIALMITGIPAFAIRSLTTTASCAPLRTIFTPNCCFTFISSTISDARDTLISNGISPFSTLAIILSSALGLASSFLASLLALVWCSSNLLISVCNVNAREPLLRSPK